MTNLYWLTTLGVLLTTFGDITAPPVDYPNCDISVLIVEVGGIQCKIMNRVIPHDHFVDQELLQDCKLELRCSNGQFTGCTLDGTCVNFAGDCAKIVEEKTETTDVLICVQNRD